jgi:hypothetical protein
MVLRSDRINDDLHVLYTQRGTLYAARVEPREDGLDWVLADLRWRVYGPGIDYVLSWHASFADVLYEISKQGLTQPAITD